MDIVWQGEIPGLDAPGRVVRDGTALKAELFYGPIGWTEANERDSARVFREAFASELRRREAQAALDALAESRRAENARYTLFEARCSSCFASIETSDLDLWTKFQERYAACDRTLPEKPEVTEWTGDLRGSGIRTCTKRRSTGSTSGRRRRGGRGGE